jgi:deoxyadenosine/deoxycytidine kinase
MKHKFIDVEGNIGSGKTSLSRKLSNDFNSELILEAFSENPFLPKFYKNPKKYGFSLELFFMAERYHQLKNKWVEDLFFPSKVSDYFFMKSKIFATTNLKSDELLLFNRLFDIMLSSLPHPNLLIYLHANTDRLKENIKKRGRDFELDIKEDYLKSIENSYFDYLKKQRKFPALILDVSDVDFIENHAIYAKIKSLMYKDYDIGLHHISI